MTNKFDNVNKKIKQRLAKNIDKKSVKIFTGLSSYLDMKISSKLIFNVEYKILGIKEKTEFYIDDK